MAKTRLDDAEEIDPRVAEDEDDGHLGVGTGAPTSGLSPRNTGSKSAGMPPASAIEKLDLATLRSVLDLARSELPG